MLSEILVPLDGSELAERALSNCAELALELVLTRVPLIRSTRSRAKTCGKGVW
jgi:hypothetical protein